MAQVSPVEGLKVEGESWDELPTSPTLQAVELSSTPPTIPPLNHSVTIRVDTEDASASECSMYSRSSAPSENEDIDVQQHQQAEVFGLPMLPRKPATASPGSTIAISLESANLWQQFYMAGTEMIITKAGRRMFPGIVISVTGLEPESKYSLMMEVNPADNHRYKFLTSKWVVVGKADAHSEELLRYPHPDGVASGKHWMSNKVSFKKLKVTNSKSVKKGQVSLNSMHRYLPRIIVYKNLTKKQSAIVHTQDFPECCFIAVTAYQNDQVTQLKIDHNPFAKAFRENPNDQDMYSCSGWYPPASPMSAGYPNDWQLQSPIPPCLPSSGLQLPSGSNIPSPLPQFNAAFAGNCKWESPPYSPNPFHSPVPLPSPSSIHNRLWSTNRIQQDSPPVSPLVSPAFPLQNASNSHGESCGHAQFPPCSAGWQH